MKKQVSPWRMSLLFGLLLTFLLPGYSLAADPITVSIKAPSLNQPVDGSLAIRVNITSVNEIKQAKAVVGATEALLTRSCTDPGCEWTGELSLEGIAKGPQTLTVTATDIYDQAGSSAVLFRHDSPPAVTIAEPADQTVIRDGQLHVVLEAEDDLTPAPLEYLVSIGDDPRNPTTVFVDSARGESRFDRVIDVSAYGGKTLYIEYQVGDLTDPYGAPIYRTRFFRQVYVEPTEQPDPVIVSITAPTSNQPVDGTLVIRANMTAVHEIKQAKAAVGSTEALLTRSCTDPGCEWTGELSLDGIAKGPQTLTVTATDSHDQTGSSTVQFRHDAPPVVTVAEPADQSVVRDGLLHVVFEAEDDLTSSPLEYLVSIGEDLRYPFFVDSARGESRFDRVIDVSGYEGKTINIEYLVGDLTDPYGAPIYRTRVIRQIYVEPRPNTGDTTAPVWPSANALKAGDVTSNSVKLKWRPATDDTGVYKYWVYVDDTLLAAVNGDVVKYEAKGLYPESTYRFSIVAVDASGNRSSKQNVTVTTEAYNP